MKLGKTTIMSFSGDITKISFVDAIVNPTNIKLEGKYGISEKVHLAAGPELKEACKQLNGCKIGQAKITNAFNLPCKYIIHTASPAWKDGKHGEGKLLSECYKNVLQEALDHGIQTIAFPSISTGFHGFPEKNAAHIAVHAVYNFLANNPDVFTKIVWVFSYIGLKDIYDQEIDALSPEAFSKLAASLSNYKNPQIQSISIQDFVIHKSSFKCMHLGHKMRTIDGSLSIVDKTGTIRKIKVPAGYCPDCKAYFILESTYKDILFKGVPLCKISSESNYLSGKKAVAGGMLLADQSILKQYGYSVSESDDLPVLQRRRILTFLIDKGIMTKTGILSYLDFFIKTKKGNHKYNLAVSKWESDRSYIAEYKIGSHSEVAIKSLHMK